MKKKELTTPIGIISLSHVEFGEILIDIFLDIQSLSDDIQEKISKDIEFAKAEQLRKLKEYYANKELLWSAENTDTEMLLHISICNYSILTWVEADVTDKENYMLWASARVKVDLSDFVEEIKPFIIKAFIKKLDEFVWNGCVDI